MEQSSTSTPTIRKPLPCSSKLVRLEMFSTVIDWLIRPNCDTEHFCANLGLNQIKQRFERQNYKEFKTLDEFLIDKVK